MHGPNSHGLQNDLEIGNALMHLSLMRAEEGYTLILQVLQACCQKLVT